METKPDITILGSRVGRAKNPEEAKLESFPNPKVGRNFTVTFDMPEPEVLCNCEITNQPDWYRVQISYIPNKLCLEQKSLKLYLQSYYLSNAFCERFTNKIADDIVKAIDPLWIRVTAKMVPRGGITIQTEVELKLGS